MSDISVLSNQYDQLVSTSNKVNNSVVAFKKKSLLKDSAGKKKYPTLSVSAEEVAAAREVLTSFLESIQKLLVEDLRESVYVPLVILDDYKEKLSENPYLKEDLKKILHLLKNDEVIGEDNLLVLDGILAVLDMERSTLFRKLRTARG